MADEQRVRDFLAEFETEFVSLLRAKYGDYPRICGLASHALLAWTQTRIVYRLSLEDGAVHNGGYVSSRGQCAADPHVWIQIGALLVDPTYEQFSSAHFGRFRVAAVGEVVGYETYEATAAGGRHVERATLTEFLGQYAPSP